MTQSLDDNSISHEEAIAMVMEEYGCTEEEAEELLEEYRREHPEDLIIVN